MWRNMNEQIFKTHISTKRSLQKCTPGRTWAPVKQPNINKTHTDSIQKPSRKETSNWSGTNLTETSRRENERKTKRQNLTRLGRLRAPSRHIGPQVPWARSPSPPPAWPRPSSPPQARHLFSHQIHKIHCVGIFLHIFETNK